MRNSNNAQTGIDEIIFEIFPDEYKNERHKGFKIRNKHEAQWALCVYERKSHRWELKVNLPRGAAKKKTNLIPYKINKNSDMELSECLKDITDKFDSQWGYVPETKIKRLELCYTERIASKQDISDLCNFMFYAVSNSHIACSLYTNYDSSQDISSLEMQEQRVYVSGMQSKEIKGMLCVKIYDKGKKLKKDKPYLRIEYIIQEQHLRAVLKPGNIHDVLKADSLKKMEGEFKRIHEKYIKIIIDDYIETLSTKLNLLLKNYNPSVACRKMLIEEKVLLLTVVDNALEMRRKDGAITCEAKRKYKSTLKKSFCIGDIALEIIERFYASCY